MIPLGLLRHLEGGGEVYFIASRSGRVKIGFTGGDPADRVRDLRTGASERLVFLGSVPGSRRTEARFHEEFQETRVWRNREWFEPTLGMVSLMGALGVRPTAAVLCRALVVSTLKFILGAWPRPGQH